MQFLESTDGPHASSGGSSTVGDAELRRDSLSPPLQMALGTMTPSRKTMEALKKVSYECSWHRVITCMVFEGGRRLTTVSFLHMYGILNRYFSYTENVTFAFHKSSFIDLITSQYAN